MSVRVRLDRYDNSHFSPGRSRLWQAAWLFLGLPIFRSSWLPSSHLRVMLLRAFGARIGKGVVIRSSVAVKFPWHLIVGNHCWIGERVWIDNLTTVRLGDHVCLSQGVYLCPGSHDWTDPAFGLQYAAIHLDDASWVGAQALVHAGTHLHQGAVITAGSVASGRFGSWKIFSGHPARYVRERRIHAREEKRHEVAA